jgi:integrative and conjugative element protein (TIGR02256 family)
MRNAGMPRPTTGTVNFDLGLIATMRRLADRAYPLETGGALMGFVSQVDSNLVFVTDVIGPGKLAVHSKFAFEPDYPYQESRIEKIYFNSGKRHTYLGDWHTHPDSLPNLSSKDKKAMKQIRRHREARAKEPLMAILGFGTPWDLKVWRLVKSRRYSISVDKFSSLTVNEKQIA